MSTNARSQKSSSEQHHLEEPVLMRPPENAQQELEELIQPEHHHDSDNNVEQDRYDEHPLTTISSLSRPVPTWPKIGRSEWLPISLTRIYLLSLATLSISMGTCCFGLVAYSRTHNGLADAGSGGVFEFNQKFLPTFVAVLYTLLWAPVVIDVVRTEPWAKMASSSGSTAQESLLKGDQMWWNHVADAFRNKKHPGVVRYAILIAIIASFAASVIINPLSAGLFDSLELLVTEEVPFSRIDSSKLGTRPPQISDTTYLRAITNLLFNLSTSSWTTDEYAVAPFWPSHLERAPLAASLAPSPQIWNANQDVFTAQVKCRPFQTVLNSTERYGETSLTGLPYLQTDDGCAVIPPNYNEPCGGGVWEQISNTSSQTTFQHCLDLGYREYFTFCSRNETTNGLLHQGFLDGQSNYHSGHVCGTSYFTANVPVKVLTTPSGSTVSVNEERFITGEVRMNLPSFNIDEFESEFIRQTGSNHLRPTLGIGLMNLPTSDPKLNFDGPSLVLAAVNNYSVDDLIQMDTDTLAHQATIIKQRFLGEVLLSEFSHLAKATTSDTFRASISRQRRRVVVDMGVGIAMGITFIVLACASTILTVLVALKKRPLHLPEDPSKSSTAALLLSNGETSTCFKDLDNVTASELDTSLKGRYFQIRHGELILVQNPTVDTVKSKTSSKAKRGWLRRPKVLEKKHEKDWRSLDLQRRSGLLLLLLLLVVAVALITVYSVSRRKPLYRSAFIYESDIRIGNAKLTTLAPYSIIPTLVAVGIKLWWAIVDGSYRRLTPFLGMAKSSPPGVTTGANLTYLTTPILWITLLTLRKGHRLLALITFATLTSEVLQISMSALWKREPGVVSFDVDLTRQFELRSVPHLFEDFQHLYRHGSNIAFPSIARYLYGGALYQTSWVYSSLAETAFGASNPAWSKDGWNFPPVDMSGIWNSLPTIPPAKDAETAGVDQPQYINVTFVSPALRGRVECDQIDDWSRWVLEVNDLDDIPLYASTSNTTGRRISSGFELSPEVRVVNFTGFDGTQPATVAIGEWLHFGYSTSRDRGYPLYDRTTPKNFTVLWINASYPYLFQRDMPQSDAVETLWDIPPRLIFAEKPQIQALNCQPIFETSTARIIVDAKSGTIRAYDLLEPAKPFTDAWTRQFNRHFGNESAYYDTSNDFSSGTDTIEAFNTTVSWGYLFQLALLQACNAQGFVDGYGNLIAEGIPGATPFSFIEPDLYSDPYSYASLALSNNDRTALLDSNVLTTATQRVFSTFFQWFVSSESGYKDNFWAYQPLDAKLPADLDFGPTESFVVSIETRTYAETFCESRMSTYELVYTTSESQWTKTHTRLVCATPTSISYSFLTKTMQGWTIQDTQTPLSSSQGQNPYQEESTTRQPTLSYETTTSIKSQATPAITSVARLKQRETSIPPTDVSGVMQATVTVRTDTLAVSPIALFLSVTIIVFLMASTIFVYLLQNKQLRLFPRDFDSPASLLAAVHASAKLKAWAMRNCAVKKENGGRGSSKSSSVDHEVAVRMGYFIGADQELHWGIEVGEDHPLLSDKSTQSDALQQSEGEESNAHADTSSLVGGGSNTLLT